MKIKFTKTTALVMAAVFGLIICVSGFMGFMTWRNNMAFSLDAEATYLIGSSDFTGMVQYLTLTNTFTVSFIFTMFGVFVGFVIDNALFVFYVLTRLVIDNRGYLKEKKKANKEYKKDLAEIKKKKEEVIKQGMKEREKNNRKVVYKKDKKEDDEKESDK